MPYIRHAGYACIFEVAMQKQEQVLLLPTDLVIQGGGNSQHKCNNKLK